MLIENYTIEFLSGRSARLSWTGAAGLLAWVFVNGRAASGALSFGGTARSVDVKTSSPLRVEIHEVESGESVSPVETKLERMPLIWWSPATGAAKYAVCRKPSAAGAESVLRAAKHVDGRGHFEIRPLSDLMADGGVWNFFRVESVSARGVESARSLFPFFIQGLPPPPVSVEVTGSGGVFDVALGVA
jgi:hypothetical protein